MRIIDPGHIYQLNSLDGPQENELVYVKREGEGYPGNVGSHAGTTLQEVQRAQTARLRYVNAQIPCAETERAIRLSQEIIYLLELRAARRHGRADIPTSEQAEFDAPCAKCGHVGCMGECHA